MRPSPPALPIDFVEAVGLTPERRADLDLFTKMLAQANETMNLVGPSTLSDFWIRHFVDSAQLLWFSPETRVWADLGSGAGLPGLILAILLKGRPDSRVHLVESMAKRCRFLQGVVDACDLPAIIHNDRAEKLKLPVEVVTARACAPLNRLLGFAQPFMARGARGLFLKGAEVESELAEAEKMWRFKVEKLESLSDRRGRVLKVEGLTRVHSR